MAPKIPHRNLPQLLLVARESLLSHFRTILNHFGLTEQQWRIMRNLHENGAMEPNQLCQNCQILSPSMVGVLGRMQIQGLVERERSCHDQRRVNVSLTPEGHSLCEQISPLVEAQYQLIEETVGNELINATYAQIDKLLSAPLDKVPAVELPPVPTTA